MAETKKRRIVTVKAKDPDEGWDPLAAELGLEPAALDARIAPIAEAALRDFEAVRARYADIYRLKLPSWMGRLAALVRALGELPKNPEPYFWEPEAGWARGNAWLDAALGMRSSGILDWFAPGGLGRKTKDAAAMHDEVPEGGEGPLDPRLDMRYRRDAPQFVTFLGGDSDGLHWGMWYDSPDHFPVTVHNYARDSAETWLDDQADAMELLRFKVRKEILAAKREVATYRTDDTELRPYALGRWRALRVIDAHLGALDRWSSARPAAVEPLCPWPRTRGAPTGSPPLALRPDAGTVPGCIPGLSRLEMTPSVKLRKAWIEDARRALADGQAAFAHALGLYLHWLDAEDLREEAGALLIDAYEALGFRPFADIARVHLLHRDLPSVGVFGGED
jgi:hypothetical protein